MPFSCFRRSLALVAAAAAFMVVSSRVTAQESAAASAPQPSLSLAEAIELAQRQGLAAEMARNSRDAAASRDRAFAARMLPQLSVAATAMDLNRGIVPVLLPNGETRFAEQSQNQSTVGLTVTQELPWTGGQLEVFSGLSRVDLFGDVSTRVWQSTPVEVGYRQGIMRPRALLWDSREQELAAAVAERQYLEAREEVASTTSAAFFDLYAAQLALENQIANAAVNDTLYTLNQGRYDVGRIGENDLLQSELALLRSRAALDGARLERDRAEAALRRLLRLPTGTPLVVEPPDDAADIVVDPAMAVAQALHNASAIPETELQVTRARRQLNAARLNNGIGATVSASVGFNQTAPGFSAAYESPLSRQRLTLGVDMPLVQWGGGRADVQAARAEERRAESGARARREAMEEEAHFAALQLTQAQRVLVISRKADTVATKRFDVAKNRYVIGRIGIGELYIAQQEKDAALQAYVQALRGYWAAHYRLRRLTLYDFAAGRELRRQ